MKELDVYFKCQITSVYKINESKLIKLIMCKYSNFSRYVSSCIVKFHLLLCSTRCYHSVDVIYNHKRSEISGVYIRDSSSHEILFLLLSLIIIKFSQWTFNSSVEIFAEIL